MAPTTGPRPLQLASASIINTLSPTDSPSAIGPFSFVGGTTGTEQTETNAQQMEGEESHQTLSLYTPPPPVRAISRPSSRRHSSISYIHSGSTPPFQASFGSESVDVFMKSPLSEAYPTSSQLPPVGQRSSGSHLSRNKSVNNGKDRRASNRTSNGSLLGDSKFVDAVKHLKERAPLTVAEKHAELLHFIAQKESKCLELRSQLAMHEAELLQLKRKWELIVNRGFEKSQNSSSSSPATSPSSNLSPSSPFLSTTSAAVPRAMALQTASSPYFPLLPGAHAPVLEGIREGVQGVSRLIAAGFESIAAGSIEAPRTSNEPGVSLHQPPLPLLLGSTSKLGRKPAKRHGQNESQSSSSTATTSTFANESAAVISSTSTRSSFPFDGPASANASQNSTQVNNEHDTDDGRDSLENSDVQSKNGTSVSDQSEQVLIVRDTGATPTMSPNPDFERKVRSKKMDDKRGGGFTGSPIKKNTKNEEDFDALDEFRDGVSPPGSKQVLKRSLNGQATRSAETSTTRVQPSKSSPPLPPMSTIPGLAAMNLAGPAAQQMSSWMGSVGKKLGEMRGSTTFTKNQKRASLLLSDMQNTFVSSLISPPSVSPSSYASGTKEKTPVLDPIFASNPLVSQPTSASLLDEFDCELAGHTDTTLLKTPILVPSTRTAPLPPAKIDRHFLESEDRTKGGSESDEDWNW